MIVRKCFTSRACTLGVIIALTITVIVLATIIATSSGAGEKEHGSRELVEDITTNLRINGPATVMGEVHVRGHDRQPIACAEPRNRCLSIFDRCQPCCHGQLGQVDIR